MTITKELMKNKLEQNLSLCKFCGSISITNLSVGYFDNPIVI